jgi:hypothetical protein
LQHGAATRAQHLGVFGSLDAFCVCSHPHSTGHREMDSTSTLDSPSFTMSLTKLRSIFKVLKGSCLRQPSAE